MYTFAHTKFPKSQYQNYRHPLSVITELSHSGARYPGVPLKVVTTWLWFLSMSLDSPKSETFALKLSSRRMFWGLISKWMISVYILHGDRMDPLRYPGWCSSLFANQEQALCFCGRSIYPRNHYTYIHKLRIYLICWHSTQPISPSSNGECGLWSQPQLRKNPLSEINHWYTSQQILFHLSESLQRLNQILLSQAPN